MTLRDLSQTNRAIRQPLSHPIHTRDFHALGQASRLSSRGLPAWLKICLAWDACFPALFLRDTVGVRCVPTLEDKVEWRSTRVLVHRWSPRRTPLGTHLKPTHPFSRASLSISPRFLLRFCPNKNPTRVDKTRVRDPPAWMFHVTRRSPILSESLKYPQYHICLWRFEKKVKVKWMRKKKS